MHICSTGRGVWWPAGRVGREAGRGHGPRLPDDPAPPPRGPGSSPELFVGHGRDCSTVLEFYWFIILWINLIFIYVSF